MKSIALCVIPCLAVLASWAHAATEAPDPALVGCWRAVKIVQSAQGVVQAEDSSGRCSLRFSEDAMESTCGTTIGTTVTSIYRYRIVRPNVYATTMTGSSFRTSLVGSTREYEYHVDGDRLVTATQLPVTLPAEPTVTVRVETQAARTPCP